MNKEFCNKNTGVLRVSSNGRFLKHDDETPFFYLGDTAWELFHRLSREDAGRYLCNRADKGFTVIQAVLISLFDGLNDPSVAGHLPLIDNDPLKPNEAYFEDVDWVVDQAGALGLYMGMLPCWGDLWSISDDDSVPVLNKDNAGAYGEWLGKRYKDKPVIWILGGDRMVLKPAERATLCALAGGLRKGDEGRHLITFHPIGSYSSGMYFHEESWLDFNMIQTGHSRNRDNYNSIAVDYGRTPVKPVIDSEPGYENIPDAFDPAHGRLDAYQARKFCYWALFSGAFGHTYGCNDIWQMYEEGRTPAVTADTSWYEAMDFPGAAQMGYARRFIESGPYFDRIPDQSLIVPPNPDGSDRAVACRAPDGRYALVYIPAARPVVVRIFLLRHGAISVTWMDPRTGEGKDGDKVISASWTTAVLNPPGAGDWVVILQRMDT